MKRNLRTLQRNLKGKLFVIMITMLLVNAYLHKMIAMYL